MILDDILARTRADLAARKLSQPIASLEAVSQCQPPLGFSGKPQQTCASRSGNVPRQVQACRFAYQMDYCIRRQHRRLSRAMG
jgi:hypothetical protein